MDCMACKTPITTFELTSVVVSAAGSAVPVPQAIAASVAAAAQHARAHATVESTVPLVQPITSVLGTNGSHTELSVLRIDNVPWVSSIARCSVIDS